MVLGLKGDPMSTVLFYLVVEKVVRDGNINRAIMTTNRGYECLAYADGMAQSSVCESLQAYEEQICNMTKKSFAVI